ncbi:hypothetical protein CAPTEDRAFT_187979 [Capitella teleta]|uniref:Uncharacterized protein n=1 Tax=Capitella teleta TaxID=283909 RepID=R7UBG9_CAPTE|nr:hypothetical protein CAPTEDRAFT_187979 [Capitella teleta]|eukprot:ELU01153.1 hypothetical protein CAPTEDRAFT_187979 [Capitella teleta]
MGKLSCSDILLPLVLSLPAMLTLWGTKNHSVRKSTKIPACFDSDILMAECSPYAPHPRHLPPPPPSSTAPIRLTRQKAELHDIINDLLPMQNWPDKVYDACYSTDLRHCQRWMMASFFWYNSIDPSLVVEWCSILDAFNVGNPSCLREFEAIFDKLNELARDPSKCYQPSQWQTFDIDCAVD